MTNNGVLLQSVRDPDNNKEGDAAPETLSNDGIVVLPPRSDGFSEIEVEHMVTMGETSAAGFVYFSAFIDWQGYARERVGIKYFPQYMADITAGRVTMLTTSCSCEYLGEAWFGDRVHIRMTSPWIRLHFAKGVFEYYRVTDDGDQLIGRGEQIWSNAVRSGDTFVPGPWSEEFVDVARAVGADTSRALIA